jgi:hypothetical protein
LFLPADCDCPLDTRVDEGLGPTALSLFALLLLRALPFRWACMTPSYISLSNLSGSLDIISLRPYIVIEPSTNLRMLSEKCSVMLEESWSVCGDIMAPSVSPVIDGIVCDGVIE